jgi:membrane protein DedA with SNARE-associated domain
LVTISFLTIGLQTVVNAAAGLIRMPWIRYTIAMLIGCVAWALIYATVGIAAVEGALALAARSPWALIVVLMAVIGVVIAFIVIRRRRGRTAAPTADTTQQTDAWLL